MLKVRAAIAAVSVIAALVFGAAGIANASTGSKTGVGHSGVGQVHNSAPANALPSVPISPAFAKLRDELHAFYRSLHIPGVS